MSLPPQKRKKKKMENKNKARLRPFFLCWFFWLMGFRFCFRQILNRIFINIHLKKSVVIFVSITYYLFLFSFIFISISIPFYLLFFPVLAFLFLLYSVIACYIFLTVYFIFYKWHFNESVFIENHLYVKTNWFTK